MVALSATPPTEDEGAKVDGVVAIGGAAVCVWGYLGLSYAALYLMVAMSMALIMEK